MKSSLAFIIFCDLCHCVHGDIQLQIQQGRILKPGNFAGPGIFSGLCAAGNKKF